MKIVHLNMRIGKMEMMDQGLLFYLSAMLQVYNVKHVRYLINYNYIIK